MKKTSSTQHIITYSMDSESKWITAHFEELVNKYGGKYIAVANETVISVGDNPKAIEEEAKKNTLPRSRLSFLFQRKKTFYAHCDFSLSKIRIYKNSDYPH